jgi:hypothetical protein
VRSLADANELDVVARQGDQAVDGGAGLNGNRPDPAPSTGDGLTDTTNPLFHLPLPRWEDVGVADAVARQTRRLTGSLYLIVALSLARKTMAPTTGDARQVHEARHALGRVPTRARVHPPLQIVNALMAARAVKLERRCERGDSMFDRRVALGTLDVVIGEMDPVHQVDVVVLIDPLGLVVAGKAAGMTGSARTAGHLFMTANARSELVYVPRVVDHKAGVGDQPRGIEVAAGASRQRLARRSILEVTEETGVRCNRDMIALNDLGVASRASELLATTQFP